MSSVDRIVDIVLVEGLIVLLVFIFAGVDVIPFLLPFAYSCFNSHFLALVICFFKCLACRMPGALSRGSENVLFKRPLVSRPFSPQDGMSDLTVDAATKGMNPPISTLDGMYILIN